MLQTEYVKPIYHLKAFSFLQMCFYLSGFVVLFQKLFTLLRNEVAKEIGKRAHIRMKK